MKEQSKNKFKIITFDNGGEFRDYKELEKSLIREKRSTFTGLLCTSI